MFNTAGGMNINAIEEIVDIDLNVINRLKSNFKKELGKNGDG